MRSGSRLPELGPRGEGWVVLQLLLGAAIAGCGFVGVYWPGSVESFFGILGLLIAVAATLLVVLGVLSLGSSFTPSARASPYVRRRDLDWAWLVACRCPARPCADRAARRALRSQGAARGGLAERAHPRTRGLHAHHAAPRPV